MHPVFRITAKPVGTSLRGVSYCVGCNTVIMYINVQNIPPPASTTGSTLAIWNDAELSGGAVSRDEDGCFRQEGEEHL
jgi:hypothetical protein